MLNDPGQTHSESHMNLPILAFALVLTAPFLGVAQCDAQANAAGNRVEARDFKFHDIFASKQGDKRIYVLLGGGFITGVSSDESSAFISGWLAAHPAATITQISRMYSTNTKTLQTSEIDYIWVEDGEHSLNVDMVRAGLFPGAAMYDMVDNLNGLNRLLEDPKLADVQAQIEKERAATPQDRTERLIAEDDYRARIRRIDAAESQARAQKLGVWSDAMRAERQSEGFP
jgi:hypothetical protein